MCPVSLNFPNAGIPSILVEPDGPSDDGHPVLLFLHGRGEASAHPKHELAKVLMHQSPPFRAIAGKLPNVTVWAPQAPPVPGKPDKNGEPIQDLSWSPHIDWIARYIHEHFGGRPVFATGFSRGGYGVLQLVVGRPGLIRAWALVDPFPFDLVDAGNIIAALPEQPRIWLRYRRVGSTERLAFIEGLRERLPAHDSEVTTKLSHGEMALHSYRGDPLSEKTGAQSLYDFFGFKFNPER